MMNEHLGEQEPHPDEPADGTPEKKPDSSVRIYVASLADYNAGRLYGQWIDAKQTAEELEHAIKDMLARSPIPGAEEWAIHDYEGFGPLRVGENQSLEYVAKIAAGIVEHGLAYAAWADAVGADHEALDAFEDVYYGAWDSLEQYAQDVLEDLGYMEDVYRNVPDHIRPYVIIDVKGFARDLEMGGDITVVRNPAGGVWIFAG
jgi:antirestriction protein